MWLPPTSMRTTEAGTRLVVATNDAGSALVVVLLLGILLGALGASAALVVDVETTVSANHRLTLAVRHAAMGGTDVVVQELALLPDWSQALTGSATSMTLRGALVLPSEAGGGAIDGPALTARLQQESYGAEGWGTNTPQWRLFGHDAAEAALPVMHAGSGIYLLVWVSDDIGESDDDPWSDNNGTVVIRARAVGPRNSQSDVQTVVTRVAAGIVRRVSSRVVR